MVSGQSWGTSGQNENRGLLRKPSQGWKEEKSEKTFYWCWYWVWQLPLSKNKLPMAVGQEADIGTCQRQTAEVAAALVKWAWRPWGAGASVTVSRLWFSAGSLLKQPLWAGSQNNQKCRWYIPLSNPCCLRKGGGARRRALEQQRDAWRRCSNETIPGLRRGSSGEGWMDELSTPG